MNSDNGRKIFLSDLDGSLLTKDKKVSPKTMDVLKRFVAEGNTFAICTGRDINSALSVYEGLGVTFKGSYVVAYNGGQIYDVDNKCTVFRQGIEQGLARELLDMAKEYGIYVHTYNDHFILSEVYNECTEYYRRVIKTPLIIADDITPYMDVPPCKIICIELHDHEKQERFRLAVLDKYSDKLDLMYSNDYYLELIPKGSGKGNALIRLSEYLNISRENTIAAGDGENDISMIEAAGLGIAMINAPDVVKQAADVVTKTDNDHDGLADILASQ
ncbi:MAG: HAD family phosphatase [Eubacterium sp.]|nr:HAD family phosphatase [Eubacterium sp.]